MAFDIVTLTPFAQVNGGYDPTVNTVDLLPGPDEIGGGSVSDGSDASYVELGTRIDVSQPLERQDHPDLFSVDFTLDSSAHPNPTWAYLSIRAKNASAGDPVWDTAIPHASFHRTDDPTGYIYDPLLPAELRGGEQSEAAWFDQFYQGVPVTPGDPGDATHWGNLARDWPTLLDALTTTGLRVGFYCFTDSAAVRVPVLDLYEVRLVVACLTAAPPPPAARSTPSLRMLQRGGQGGMSGIPRMIGNPVRGLRQGPGSVL